MENNKRIECSIVGRVQMVMYRDFATRHARALGLTGTVQNMSNGSVRVVAEGVESALHLLIEKLNKGPILADVDKVDVVWKEVTGEFTQFTLLY